MMSSTLPLTVGFDMEWTPHRFSGDNNPVDMLQLSCGPPGRCALLRTCAFEHQLPQGVWDRVFMNPNVTLVGVGLGNNDGAKLRSTFGVELSTLRCQKVDVQQLARAQGMQRLGMQSLAQDLLHPSFAKPGRLTVSNWGAPNLSLEQYKYAALDAICSEHIYKELCLRSSQQQQQ